MNRKFNVVSLSTKRVITAIAGGCAALVLSAHLAASTLVNINTCLLYTSPSPRDLSTSRMPSSA